jgi:hypothetical protein
MIENIPSTPSDFLSTKEGDTLGRAQYYVNQTDWPERGRISDGYHSFDELYTHRIHLFIALAKAHYRDPSAGEVWMSKKHKDGSEWPGWFVLGIGHFPGEQVSYHLPEKYWPICQQFARVMDSCLTFDGHSSDDVLKRLLDL